MPHDSKQNEAAMVVLLLLKKTPHPQNLWADSGSGRPPIV
jgi:hypothetical protein